MTLTKIIGRSLVVAGIVGLLGCTQEQDSRSRGGSVTKKTSGGVVVKEKDYNRYIVLMDDPAPTFSPVTGIYSYPEGQTGVSAEVDIHAQDKGKNAGIARLVLYEDGREIASAQKAKLHVIGI